MVIDQEGEPFAWKASTPVPDNVVVALSKWRFHPARRGGAAVPSGVAITMPIRRSIEEVAGIHRSWRLTKEENDSLGAGRKLDDASAAELVAKLEKKPDDESSRLMLLEYSSLHSGPATDRMRLDQILWLARKDLKAPVLGAPLSVPNQPAQSDAVEYEQLRLLWRNALVDDPGDPEILDHATNVLRFSDPGVVEEAAKMALSSTDGAAAVLGDLYGLAVLGVTAVDSVSGQASAAGDAMPDTPFARSARTALAKTDNMATLFSALHTVSGAGYGLTKTGHLPAGYADFCNELLARAKDYYPATLEKCDTTLPSGPLNPTPILRTGGNVQAAKLVKMIRPGYPADAKARGITGTVTFEALIGREGMIRRLEFVTGPLALYKASRDAVSHWEYTPTLLNGKPVEVITTIDVNFSLN